MGPRFVDMQQFVDIVEAEEVRAHSRFSKNLRILVRSVSVSPYACME